MKIAYSILFIFLFHQATGQSFIAEFKKYKIEQIKDGEVLDSLRKSPENDTYRLNRKQIRQAKRLWMDDVKKQLLQYDLLFKSYYTKTGFNFNNAPVITIINLTNVQSKLRRCIIFSENDTIQFGERWIISDLKNKRKEMVDEPFVKPRIQGYIVPDERDSLLALAGSHDIKGIKKLANENASTNGSSAVVVFARLAGGVYSFQELSLQPFMIAPVWRNKPAF